MAQPQSVVDRFISEIGTLESSFNSNLSRVVDGLSGLSDRQLIDAIGQLNLFDELINAGYGDALNNLENGYGELLQDSIALAESRGIAFTVGEGLQGLQTLQELNTADLLGEAQAHSTKLTNLIFQNLYNGRSSKEIVDELVNVKLKDYRMNVAVDTAIKTFDDTARYQVFKGQDVRWTYFGPNDTRTRDICKQTILNEPAEGYTEEEVNNLKTPFGLRGGFNCRHSWTLKA
ncbi:hypothetical protein [Marinobacter sp.]|jgi:hypothetical protein|uniref:hypothetical protein n=1 Tax=Marinobacter sp. TaxID=50741 RepID=UPI0023562FF1|nr:hypothetical protein [Marinobacter sp.]|tara:strand:- start:194 stop:889 length:696 start_codon:yes stop_codon:yes gene_type:complete